MNYFEKFAEWVYKYRRWICGISILLFVVLTPFAALVTPDNSEEAVSVIGDPQVALIKRIESVFGSEDYITVTFEAKDILDAKSLAIVDKLSQYFTTQPEVAHVLSLTTVSKLQNEQDKTGSSIHVLPFIDSAWMKTGVPADQRKKLLNMPLYQALLYNASGSATSVMAQLIPLGSDDPRKSALINRTKAIIAELSAQTEVKFHIFGLPVAERAIYDTIQQELNTLNPLMILVIILLVIYLYRNLYITLITLVQFVMTLAIVVGFLGVFHVHFNWLTVFAPAVMIIMSICDAVYVINEFQQADYSLPYLERLKIVFKNIGVPCLFTSITNGFGFASLLTSPVRPLREYGGYVAVAVIVEYFISFTLFPILLNTPKSKAKGAIKKQNPFLKNVIGKMYHWVVNRPKSVLAFCAILAAFSILGATRLVVNEPILNIFKDDPLELATNNGLIKKGAGGGFESHLFIDTSQPDLLLEPVHLQEIENTAKDILRNEKFKIKKVISIVDYIKYFNQVLHGDDPVFYKIPATKDEIAQILFLMEMDADKLNLRQFVTTDYSKGLVRFFSAAFDDVNDSVAKFTAADQVVEKNFKSGLDPKVTAKARVTNSVVRKLPSTIIISLATSFIFIGLAMMLLFRSVYVGFLSMLPSILPILMVAGIMGYLGVWIDIATSMTFAVSLGIAMDDTVNLIWRLKRNVVERGMSYEAGLKSVYDEIGVPLIGSSVLLAGGYLMLIFSRLWPTTTFGIFVACSCLFALIGDLLLTPLLFLKLKPFKLKSLVKIN